VEPDEQEAKRYLQMAEDRGYKPHLDIMKKPGMECNLMREAQLSEGSVFSHVPNDIITGIMGMRIDVILARQELVEKT